MRACCLASGADVVVKKVRQGADDVDTSRPLQHSRQVGQRRRRPARSRAGSQVANVIMTDAPGNARDAPSVR